MRTRNRRSSSVMPEVSRNSLVLLLARERLPRQVVELALDLLVAEADAALLGLLLNRLGLDQELHHLLLEQVVLLLALLEQLVGGRRLGGVLPAEAGDLLLLGGHAVREVGRCRHHDVLGAARGKRRLLGPRGGLQPVVELGLLDLRVADPGDRVRGDVVATRRQRYRGECRGRERKYARPAGRAESGCDELRHVKGVFVAALAEAFVKPSPTGTTAILRTGHAPRGPAKG